MKRNNRNLSGWDILMIVVCIELFMIFAGFLIWNRNAELIETKKLKQAEVASEENTENTPGNENKTPEPVETPEAPAEEKLPEGISFWGDDFLNGDGEEANSYKTKIQNLLAENGYNLKAEDHTLEGAGTLSVMKKAGVPQTELDNYIAQHKEAATGQLPITETGIRDFTPEQLVRTDKDYIPVILMGYYGGWSNSPEELAGQQQKILDTFEANKDKFIIVGVRPLSDKVKMAEYDAYMKEHWGQHYISASEVCTRIATTYTGQGDIAQAVYERMVELKYIEKEQVG